MLCRKSLLDVIISNVISLGIGKSIQNFWLVGESLPVHGYKSSHAVSFVRNTLRIARIQAKIAQNKNQMKTGIQRTREISYNWESRTAVVFDAELGVVCPVFECQRSFVLPRDCCIMFFQPLDRHHVLQN